MRSHSADRNSLRACEAEFESAREQFLPKCFVKLFETFLCTLTKILVEIDLRELLSDPCLQSLVASRRSSADPKTSIKSRSLVVTGEPDDTDGAPHSRRKNFDLIVRLKDLPDELHIFRSAHLETVYRNLGPGRVVCITISGNDITDPPPSIPRAA